MFSSMYYMDRGLISRSFILLDWTFVHGIRNRSKFICLHTASQVFQYYLLKKLPLASLKIFPSLVNINRLSTWGSITGFSILFIWGSFSVPALHYFNYYCFGVEESLEFEVEENDAPHLRFPKDCVGNLGVIVHINKKCLSISLKNIMYTLIGTSLNLYNILGSIIVFYGVNLPYPKVNWNI